MSRVVVACEHRKTKGSELCQACRIDVYRAIAACPHGHPYDAANTYVYRGKRHCRTCRRAHVLRRYYERRAAV